MICCDWPENEANSPEDMLCSVSNAYGTGSSRERRHASNDAHGSKVEKCFVLLFRTLFFFTIVSFNNKKKSIYSAWTVLIKSVLSGGWVLSLHNSHKWSAIVGHFCIYTAWTIFVKKTYSSIGPDGALVMNWNGNARLLMHKWHCFSTLINYIAS